MLLGSRVGLRFVRSRAQHLLLNTSEPLVGIALGVGFQTQGQFSRRYLKGSWEIPPLRSLTSLSTHEAWQKAAHPRIQKRGRHLR
jgi:hypothetical protein